MKILLSIPTLQELELIQTCFPGHVKPTTKEHVFIHGHILKTIVSGAGMVNTAASTSALLSGESFDFAIQVGIAGTFSEEILVGTAVEVFSEFLPEFGAEDGSNFIPFAELGLSSPKQYPQSSDGVLRNRTDFFDSGLRRVAGITVNTVTGSEKSREMLLSRYHAEVESMEGYAFFFSCMLAAVPFACIRGISNRVGKRDRSAWKIPDAISAVALHLEQSLRMLHGRS